MIDARIFGGWYRLVKAFLWIGGILAAAQFLRAVIDGVRVTLWILKGTP